MRNGTGGVAALTRSAVLAVALGGLLAAGAAPAQEVGSKAPKLTVSDARGVSKNVKLTDFKGKWVLIEFWGYW